MPTYDENIIRTVASTTPMTPYIVVVLSDTMIAGVIGAASMSGTRETFDDIDASLSVNGSIVEVRLMLESMMSALVTAAVFAVQSEYGEVIVDRIVVSSAASQEEETDAWVMNAATKAFSQYDGYDFIALFEHEGRYFGATRQGIYQLDGDKDDGADIDAFVMTGKEDFGVTELKRLPYVYAGIKAPEGMTLTVFVDSGASYTYAIPPSATMQNQRAIIGKALRSRYWQIALRNIEGGMFTIESMELLPTGQERKLNGN